MMVIHVFFSLKSRPRDNETIISKHCNRYKMATYTYILCFQIYLSFKKNHGSISISPILSKTIGLIPASALPYPSVPHQWEPGTHDLQGIVKASWYLLMPLFVVHLGPPLQPFQLAPPTGPKCFQGRERTREMFGRREIHGLSVFRSDLTWEQIYWCYWSSVSGALTPL